MKINWIVRAKNKAFWVAIIPAILLLAQAVLMLFGVSWQPDVLNDRLLNIVNAVFMCLTIMGITTDPTTAGVRDSATALSYVHPKTDAEDEGME